MTSRARERRVGLVLCALWAGTSTGGPRSPPTTHRRPPVGHGGDRCSKWAPDGRQIAYLSNESVTSQIPVLSVADGVSRQLTRHDHPLWDPQWSPDGTRLRPERSGLAGAQRDLRGPRPGWRDLADPSQWGAVVRNARWSATGSAILLGTNAGGRFDLASGGEPTPCCARSSVNSPCAPARVVAGGEVAGVHSAIMGGYYVKDPKPST